MNLSSTPSPNGPAPAHPPKHSVAFGAFSCLAAGLAWFLVLVSPRFSRGALAGIVIATWLVAIAVGFLGLKRGAASAILSVIALILMLWMGAVWLLSQAFRSSG